MRNKHKIMIYPVYFDQNKSRRLGRRVPKSLAVRKPSIDELQLIADHLKLVYEIEEDVVHPAAWWEDYPGRLLVKKKDQEDNLVEKAPLVKKMAKYLIAVKKKKREKQKLKAQKSRYRKSQVSHKKYKRR